MHRNFIVASGLLLLSGCATYGVVENAPLDTTKVERRYSLLDWAETNDPGEDMVILALSGGGTRGAAMAYGVMEELRSTQVPVGGQSTPLLDEVDRITAVSGGSFVAAYYGLHGEAMFDRFEEEFLRQDIEGALGLKGTLFNPFNWFSRKGRTEKAIALYQDSLFHGATFADLIRPDRPFVIINATDLGGGVRFSFVQEYFDMLCSDLSSFSVARAVAASATVPVVFDPVVVENYAACGTEPPAWLVAIKKKAVDDPEMGMVAGGISSYYDRDKRRYVHFVNGAITDNLGLRAVYEMIELSGGAKAFAEKAAEQPPRRYVVIAVDASTDPPPGMGRTLKQPALVESIRSMSDTQRNLYSTATIALMEKQIVRWAEAVSTPDAQVSPYFIHVTFRSIQDPESSRYFSTVPTSFNLTDEQVDRVRDAGRQLLRENPEYQRLLADIRGGLPAE